MEAKKVILIFFSAILVIASIVIVFNKTIIPLVKNANYEKDMEKRNAQFSEQIKQQEEEKQKEQENQATTDDTPTVPENDGQRVGTYIGQYISLLNSKKYDKAYGLLNEGFKELNFPTLESYVEYVKEKYSRQKSVQYVKFKLEGYVYVVDTVIKDLPIYENPQEFKQVFRFQETNSGEFNLSFGI